MLILLEYLPGASPINCLNYSKDGMDIAIQGIKQIHELALVEHLDPDPNNILIVPGPPERVVWADFDIAISFKNPSQLTACKTLPLSSLLKTEWFPIRLLIDSKATRGSLHAVPYWHGQTRRHDLSDWG